jgi:methionyl-tRNA synthetase
LTIIEGGFMTIGEELEGVHLRNALGEAMRLATEVNRYLDKTAPWKTIKTDKQAAARSIYCALRAIDSLKILFSPFLPYSSEKLHGFFGYTQPLFGEQRVLALKDEMGEHKALTYQNDLATGRWEPSQILPGRMLEQPQPLFIKLESKIIEEERARLGNK